MEDLTDNNLDTAHKATLVIDSKAGKIASQSTLFIQATEHTA